MESPSQPLQPAPNDSLPLQNHDACTKGVAQSAETQTRKPDFKAIRHAQPHQQATDIQRVIRDTIQANGISTETLSSLSRVWLDLERFKRSLRAPRKSKAVKPAPAPAPPPQEPSEAP